jgi:hypothetical protein
MRKQQLLKVLKHYTKNYLVHKVYNLGYYFDYDCELLEYSPRERYTDYATNHAHDVATANNDICELWEQSKGYLFRAMVDLIKANNSLQDDLE